MGALLKGLAHGQPVGGHALAALSGGFAVAGVILMGELLPASSRLG